MPSLYRYLALIYTGLIPWIVLRFLAPNLVPLPTAFFSGLCILSAAFLLGIAADLLKQEISTGLTVALLALLAVLPEYAVDIYFAWRAGQDPHYIGFALANMTGANRLLIGVGWAMLVIVYFWRSKKKNIQIEKKAKLDVYVLYAATIYAFFLPFKETLSLLDSFLFFSLYIYYIMKTSKEEKSEEPPEEYLEPFLRRTRKEKIGIAILLFLSAGIGILLSAEPFSESLIALGRQMHIDDFLLIQWVAPLASETPELLTAFLFTWKGSATTGLRILISSKINQWTLLVSMVPLFYALSGHNLSVMPLDLRQKEELFLTAAQSLFAAWLIIDLSFSLWDGLFLLSLFFCQFLFPSEHIRSLIALVYLLLILTGPLWRRGNTKKNLEK